MNQLKDLQRDIYVHVTAGSRQLDHRQHELVIEYVSICASIPEVRDLMTRLQLTESDLFLIYHKLALAGLSQYVNGHVVSLSSLADADCLSYIVSAENDGTESLEQVRYLLRFWEERRDTEALLNIEINKKISDKVEKEKPPMWITDVETKNPPVNLCTVTKIEAVDNNKIHFGNSCTWLLEDQQQRDAVLGNIMQLLERECLVTQISRKSA